MPAGLGFKTIVLGQKLISLFFMIHGHTMVKPYKHVKYVQS